MESTQNEITREVKSWASDYRTKGVTAPPDLSRELDRLETLVDQYLSKHDSSTAPLKNSLRQLLADQEMMFRDDANAIDRAKKNIDTLADIYEQIWRKHRRAHKLTAVLLTGKGMTDILGLATVFDKTFWPVGAAYFAAMSTDFSEGKWKVRGDLLVGRKSMEMVNRKLQMKHLELKQELQARPQNLDDAILRTGKIRYLSKECWDLAKELQKEIGDRQKAVQVRNGNIATVLKRLTERVDRLLAKRAVLRQCVISPSPIEFAKVGESRPVSVMKMYGTGLAKKAAGTEVTFEYDLPRVVTFSTTGDEIVATAVAAGSSEVKITITEGSRQATARVTVEVGGAGSGLKLMPEKIQMNTGGTNKLGLFKLDPSGQRSPVQSGIQWRSDDPQIATVDTTGAVHGRSAGSTQVWATFQGGKVSASIQVVRPAGPPPTTGRPVIGIAISSASGDFLLDTPITFTRQVSGANAQNQYAFSWLLDGEEVKAGKSFERRFLEPGRHYVQLVMRSSDPRENDAVIKNFNIEYPAEVEASIVFVPETSIYEPGATVGLLAKTKGAEGVTEFRWYVNDEYVGSGAEGVAHTFPKAGAHEVKLGIRLGSNFDEVETTRVLRIGDSGIGTLGRWRNRFEATGAPENLVIRSSYWVGGDGKWSQPSLFSGGTIGPVENYLFYTGEQADGWNTGYLIYTPKGQKDLQFKVFHFRWPENPRLGPAPQGFVHYAGMVPKHSGKSPVLESARFVREASRMCEVEWQNQDGSSCMARISKFNKSDTIRFSGVEHFGCKESSEPVQEGNLPLVLLKTSRGDLRIELFEDEAPNTVANFISLVDRGFYDGLTVHRVIKGMFVQTGCPNGDGTGGPGYHIANESVGPGGHKAVPGSLVMALSGKTNTGGSQFLMLLRPMPHLDGKYPVFGQVVDGMDVVTAMQQQDRIINAKVLRKRDHAYTPTKTSP